MKPVVFEQITDKYRNGYYSAQVGPVQIMFDFGEDEIFVEIILWGNFKDLKCNRGLDCRMLILKSAIGLNAVDLHITQVW